MFRPWGLRARAYLPSLPLIPMTTVAQASPPHQKAVHLRDRAHVVHVASQVAAGRTPKTRARSRVEPFSEKDGTGAVLTRIPEP